MSQLQILDKITRGTKAAGLGTKLNEIINLVNQITAWQNATFNAAGLVIGSVSAAKVKITNTVNYVINGAFKSIATQEVAFTAGGVHDIPANASVVQEATYILSVNLAGTVSITRGAIANGSGNSVAPAVPAAQAVVGRVVIAVAAGAVPFTAATTLLSNAALTVTYTDLDSLPITAPSVDVLT